MTVPHLTLVVRGRPTPEELAAVVTVLASRRGSGAAEPAAPEPSAWRTPLRAPLPPPGPGAWQAALSW